MSYLNRLSCLSGLNLGRVVSVALLTTMVSAPRLTCGQETANSAPAITPAAEAVAVGSDDIPEDLKDSAFDRFVDLHEIGRAWGRLDASALADVALQLREGERVLLRSHKAVKGSKVMELTLSLAIKNQDQETLARLAQAAKSSGDQELSQRIAAATKVAAASRSAEAPLLVAVGETTAEGFIEIQDLVKQLNAARVASDATGLNNAIESIAQSTHLSEKQREQLNQMASQAKAAIAPQEGNQGDSTMDALNKLAGPSRGNQDYYYNILYSNGSRKTMYFSTYQAAAQSRASNTTQYRCSDVVGPPTVFKFPAGSLTVRTSLPSGVNVTYSQGYPLIGKGGAGITEPVAVEQIKTFIMDGRIVAAGGGNLKPGYSTLATNGVITLSYVKK